MWYKMVGALKQDLKNSEEDAQENKMTDEILKMDLLIKSSLKGTLNFCDSEEKVSPIECESRDGFISGSHNKGGYTVSSLMLSLEEAIGKCSQEKGRDALEKLIKNNMEMAEEEVLSENREELEEKGVSTIAQLRDLIQTDVKIEKKYNDAHGSYRDSDAVRYEIRVMYNGMNDEDKHCFTVDSQINWEAPYFRDSKGMSVYQETEIEVKDCEELSSALKGAISQVKALFNS